jgi:hypothetical protein
VKRFVRIPAHVISGAGFNRQGHLQHNVLSPVHSKSSPKSIKFKLKKKYLLKTATADGLVKFRVLKYSSTPIMEVRATKECIC